MCKESEASQRKKTYLGPRARERNQGAQRLGALLEVYRPYQEDWGEGQAHSKLKREVIQFAAYISLCEAESSSPSPPPLPFTSVSFPSPISPSYSSFLPSPHSVPFPIPFFLTSSLFSYSSSPFFLHPLLPSTSCPTINIIIIVLSFVTDTILNLGVSTIPNGKYFPCPVGGARVSLFFATIAGGLFP